MKYIWDTTVTPNQYPENIKKIYYNKILHQRKNYTKWIGRLSKKFKYSVDWWSTNIVTRNPYISSIYKSICLIETIRELLKQNIKLNLIINKKFSNFIINNFKNEKKIVFEISENNNQYFFEKIKFINSIIFQVILFFFIKIFVKKKS